jgi:hypothetical protein
MNLSRITCQLTVQEAMDKVVDFAFHTRNDVDIPSHGIFPDRRVGADERYQDGGVVRLPEMQGKVHLMDLC